MTFITDTASTGNFTFGRFPTFSALLDLRRQRRALSKLDEAALTDMGLTREQATTEASRRIWDVPANWRC